MWTEFDYEGGNATSVHLFLVIDFLGICCDIIFHAEGSPTGRGRGRGGRGRGRSRSNYGKRMDSSVFLFKSYFIPEIVGDKDCNANFGVGGSHLI